MAINQAPDRKAGSVLARLTVYLKKFARQSAMFEIIAELTNFRLSVRYRIMRIAARSDMARRRAARAMNWQHPVRSIRGATESILTAEPASRLAGGLKSEGFAEGIALTENLITEVLKCCAAAKFSPNMAPESLVRINYYTATNPGPPSFLYYCGEVHRKSGVIAAIAHDPLIHDVVGQYLGAEPLLLGSRLFWSFPQAQDDGSLALPEYGFHYDIDDYRFVKLFFCLTDVDDDCGPHVIIAKTHLRKSWSEKLHRRAGDARVLRLYAGSIRTITGRRGFGFFEDTFCYHKGTAPKRPRLMLEFEWALQSFPIRARGRV